VADPHATHVRKLRYLQAASRFWTATAGALVAAAAVLLPYQGLGPGDAFWAAGAVGSSAIAYWRWRDYRALSAQPVPPALPGAARGARRWRRLESVVATLPAGRTALDEMHRLRHMSRLHGSEVAQAGGRLDRAARSLAGIAGGLDNDVLIDAHAAERMLRELAERTAGVERVLKLPAATSGPREQLVASHAAMMAQLDEGVGAYEGFVTAAASVVASNGLTGDPTTIGRLTEASDKLRGMAEALAEFTRATRRQEA
jgi:hypothetical protein